jgi:hypothetical protein
MRPTTADYLIPIPLDDEDCIMLVDEYLENVKCGALIDSDGMGEVARNGFIAKSLINSSWIYPSQGIDVIPLDATHIVWYNK